MRITVQPTATEQERVTLRQKAQAAMAEQIDVGKASTLADLRAVMQKILDKLIWLETLHGQ